MIRARFHADHDDWRPVDWPPPGPCWCSGYAGDESYSVVVAYVEKPEQIKEFWPEASNIDLLETNVEPVFTDRFPKPDWWNPPGINDQQQVKP